MQDRRNPPTAVIARFTIGGEFEIDGGVVS
jgi:hypothetical protein